MTRISLSYIVLGIWAVTSCTAQKSNSPETDNESVTVLITTANGEKSFHKEEINLVMNDAQTKADITLNPSEKYQSIYGFGSAITGSTCYNLLKMNPSYRTTFLKETFSTTEGLGQSYVRISIGCSDFSMSEYTLCDKEGIENFALQSEEKEYVIPILKEILTINPDVKIIGSPWTPPRWMKVNNLKDLKPHYEWTSGHLNPKYYDDYALYFVKWLQAMKSHGIEVDAITIQNEPLNRGNSASLFMGWQEQLDFIKKSLGKRFKQEGITTKIYLFDHNFNYDNMADQKDYPLHIYNDKEASSYIAGAAYHNYGGHYDELQKIHLAQPDKELIFTETSIGEWNDGRNLSARLLDDMEHIGIGILNNWGKAVIVWNLMLDEKGTPNREGGCKTCYGAVDISSSDYKTITKNSHYYVIGHLSSVIKPNAVRIQSETNNKNILCTSFKNPDGSYALVLLNRASSDEEITINDGKKHFKYSIPARSVASFLWNN